MSKNRGFLIGRRDEALIEKEIARKYQVIEKETEEVSQVQQKPEEDKEVRNTAGFAAITAEINKQPNQPAGSFTEEFMNISSQANSQKNTNIEFTLDEDDSDDHKITKPVVPTAQTPMVDEDGEEYVYEYVNPHFGLKAVLIGVCALLIGVFGTFLLLKDKTEAAMKEAYLKQGYVKTDNANANAEDIRLGKTAYVNGKLITGTYIDIDTSNATATPADILKGYTAYVNGQLITGTIPTYSGNTSITPSTKNITIPAGYYIQSPIIIVGDQNLVAGNIKENVVIFDVKGIYKGQ